jgi:transcriptional regulator
MTVHAYATPRIISEEIAVRELLTELVSEYEGENGWTMDDLPDKYLRGMMQGLVALELTITRLEGKLKLSQNRSETDRRGVIAGLEQSPLEAERAVASSMRESLP